MKITVKVLYEAENISGKTIILALVTQGSDYYPTGTYILWEERAIVEANIKTKEEGIASFARYCSVEDISSEQTISLKGF